MTSFKKLNVQATSGILKETLKELHINFSEYEPFFATLFKGKLKRIEDSEKRYIEQNLEMSFVFEDSNSVDSFFSTAKKNVTSYLKQNNVESNKLNHISYDQSVDENDDLETKFVFNVSVLEKSDVYKKRMKNKVKIDFLLDNYERIYNVFSEKLASSEKIKKDKKSKLESIKLQISALEKQANELK